MDDASPPKTESASESFSRHDGWEYRVIHININEKSTRDASTTPNPEAASQKLQGALSPEFIKREFPGLYPNPKPGAGHPAMQLQNFLNDLGLQGWELIEISPVGSLLMFFLKRRRFSSPQKNSDSDGQG